MFKGFKKALEGLDSALNAAGGPLSEPSPAQARIGKQISCEGVSFRLTQLIAEGGYSFVYAAEDVYQPGTIYAVKFLLVSEQEAAMRAQAEIDILRKLPPHPHIMKFIAGSVKSGEAVVVTEMIDGGSMAEKMQSRRGRHYAPHEIMKMMADAIEAVAHLHAQNPPIAHRDIKLENILYDRFEKKYKLCDFGSCTTKACRYESIKEIAEEEEIIAAHSTLMYRAPEMVDLYQKKFVGERVDVWALGCLLYTLCYFEHPFQDGTSLQILNANYRIPDEPVYPPNFRKLITWMLNSDPEKRPDVFIVRQAIMRLTNATPNSVPRRPLGQSPGIPRPAPKSTEPIARQPVLQPTRAHLLDIGDGFTSQPAVTASTSDKAGEHNWANFEDAFKDHDELQIHSTSPLSQSHTAVHGSSSSSSLSGQTIAALYNSSNPGQTRSSSSTASTVSPAPAPLKGTKTDPFADLLVFSKK